MKVTLILAFIWLGFVPSGPAAAQERPSEKTQNAPGRYFTRPLDLWNAGLTYDPAPRPSGEAESLPPRVAVRENIWAQPIRTPDGNWMIYVPPKQVLNFLENPSEETAKAYLSWKQEQTDKLKKAMTLLARVREPGAAVPAADVPVDPPRGKALPPGLPLPDHLLQEAVLPPLRLAGRGPGRVD